MIHYNPNTARRDIAASLLIHTWNDAKKFDAEQLKSLGVANSAELAILTAVELTDALLNYLENHPRKPL